MSVPERVLRVVEDESRSMGRPCMLLDYAEMPGDLLVVVMEVSAYSIVGDTVLFLCETRAVTRIGDRRNSSFIVTSEWRPAIDIEREGAVSGKELMAAMRDASWFRNPGRAGRYHVIVQRPDGLEAACGQFAFLQRDADAFRSRGAIERAADVDPILRCRRNGCRQRWPNPVEREANTR